jgi:hypothetical protein
LKVSQGFVYGSLLLGLAFAIVACAATADEDEICIGRKGTHCRQINGGSVLPSPTPGQPSSGNNAVAVDPGS